MLIKKSEELDRFEDTISKENVEGCKKALADGCKVWVFTNINELAKDGSLPKEGREFCYKRFEDGEIWAGWLETPEQKEIVGITCGPAKYGH